MERATFCNRAKTLLSGIIFISFRPTNHVFEVGDCLIGGMVIAYGGQFGFSDRKSAIDAWKDVCEQFHIPVSKLGILEIFEPIVERSYLRADTLPPFDYYQENCLIVQKSKKWILFEDPDNLADTWIHQVEPPPNCPLMYLFRRKRGRPLSQLTCTIRPW